MGIFEDNTNRIKDTKALISQLKKVFGNNELKLVTSYLVKLKEKKSGTDDVRPTLTLLQKVVFKDQTNPKATDNEFIEKKECIEQLYQFIPNIQKPAYAEFFKPLL